MIDLQNIRLVVDMKFKSSQKKINFNLTCNQLLSLTFESSQRNNLKLICSN